MNNGQGSILVKGARQGKKSSFREHERRKLPSYPEEAFYSGNMERPGQTSRWRPAAQIVVQSVHRWMKERNKGNSHSLYRRVLGDWRYVFSILWRTDLHLLCNMPVRPRQKSQRGEVHSHHPERPLWSRELHLICIISYFIYKELRLVEFFFLLFPFFLLLKQASVHLLHTCPTSASAIKLFCCLRLQVYAICLSCRSYHNLSAQ